MVTCEICNKEVRARGYGAHLRLAHNVVSQVNGQVNTKVTSQVNNVDNLSRVSSYNFKKTVSNSMGASLVGALCGFGFAIYYGFIKTSK